MIFAAMSSDSATSSAAARVKINLTVAAKSEARRKANEDEEEVQLLSSPSTISLPLRDSRTWTWRRIRGKNDSGGRSTLFGRRKTVQRETPSSANSVWGDDDTVMAVVFVADVAAAVWHAFDFLDDLKKGQVAKSKLKVLTANLGTVLNCPNVENGLQDYRSTTHLSFDDYMFYLRKELFSVASISVLDSSERSKYVGQVEEVAWLVCRSRYLKRENSLLPDQCVFQLFRVFCMLAEQCSNAEAVVMVLPSEEVEHVVRLFVLALGREWDPTDFQQIADVVPTFKFSVFLALIENSYAKNIEVTGLVEASQEVFDVFIEDVLKKGFLSKRGQFFSSWRLSWYVLRPSSLCYFTDQSEKERRGEIPIHGKCSVEALSDSQGAKGNRFVLICGDKCFELSTADHKSKLQWITALQNAIDHHGHKESYQKRLAIRRRNDREALKSRRLDDDMNLVVQQEILEKQRSELEAEKLARVAAEAEAREQAALRERETQRLLEVEAARKELERLLVEERQAKRDEEIVRNLQARLLREEWEKREELERLQEEQSSQLVEERNKREGLEMQQEMKERHLEEARNKLRELEEEKQRLDRHLKEARDKMEVAERAKEVLEAKLRVREKSYIPLPVRPSWNRSPSNGTLNRSMTDINSNRRSQKLISGGDREEENNKSMGELTNVSC